MNYKTSVYLIVILYYLAFCSNRIVLKQKYMILFSKFYHFYLRFSGIFRNYFMEFLILSSFNKKFNGIFCYFICIFFRIVLIEHCLRIFLKQVHSYWKLFRIGISIFYVSCGMGKGSFVSYSRTTCSIDESHVWFNIVQPCVLCWNA